MIMLMTFSLERKPKPKPKLAHFNVQVNCRKEGIKDLSIILAVYGPRNWIIFAIYCPRIEWESFSLFMGPDMDHSDEFCFWILGPEISRMVQFLAPESASLFWLYKWPWTSYNCLCHLLLHRLCHWPIVEKKKKI